MASLSIQNRASALPTSRVFECCRMPQLRARQTVSLRTQALPKSAPTVSLLGVAVLWSTYGPTMRVIFADPGSPTPIMLSAIKGVISAIALISLAAAFPRREGVADQKQSDDDRRLSEDAMNATRAPGLQTSDDLPLLKRRMPNLQLASLEVGSYAACGSLIHAWGLSQIPATTAGFLLQITTVLTPIIAVIAGDRVSPRVWAAIAMAGAGTLLIGIDGMSDASGATDALASGPILGKLAILAAACCYSLGTFRLGQNSPAFNSVNLAAGKNAVRALATLAVATPELLRAFSTPTPAAPSGDFVLVATSASPVLDMAHGSAVLSTLWPSAGSVTAVALVAWAGLGPGALGSVLQTYGQRSVSPPAAQVIFTAIPVISAAIAITFLHEQPFGALGWGGASMIIAAGLAIARSTQQDAAAALAAAAPAAVPALEGGEEEEEDRVKAVAGARQRRG